MGIKVRRKKGRAEAACRANLMLLLAPEAWGGMGKLGKVGS